MKTTVERLDPVKVKLTIEVEPARMTRAFNLAAKHLAENVQLKGFRKGKVPRRLLEAQIGKDAVAQHAMEDHLGTFYAEALRAEDIHAVGQPEIDLDTWDEAEGAKFSATVEVRPEFDLPDHTRIGVTHPEWDVDMEEVESQIEQLRDRFAELDEVDRPAQKGDYVTIDLEVTVGGEPIEDATVEDALYEIGSGGVTPKLDDELPGVVAGSDLTYTDDLPDDYPEHGGEEAEFLVKVKDVRAKTLPELDDDFALTASEFESVEELRAGIRRSLLRRKVQEARHELRASVLEAFVARIDIPLPPSMIEAEKDFRINQVKQQAEQYGVDFEQLLQMQDVDPEQFERNAAAQAEQSVKAQLVLDALAREIDVTVEPREVDEEIYRQAMTRGVEPQKIAQVIEQQGSLPVLVSDIMRRKSIDALVEAAAIEGGPDDALLVELGLKQDPDQPTIDVARTVGDIQAAIDEQAARAEA